MTLTNRRSLLSSLMSLGNILIVTNKDKPADPGVKPDVLIYQDETHEKRPEPPVRPVFDRPPPEYNLETGDLSAIDPEGNRMTVRLSGGFDVTRRALPSYAAASRTNCVMCNCEIPPGKPGRNCKACR